MSDEQNTDERTATRKGDAFIRYFYIDRGKEEGLSMDEATVDFENYIYLPIAQHVMREYVEQASTIAIDSVLGEDAEIRPLTDEEALQAAQEIGLAVLWTFREMMKPSTDA